MVTTMAALPTRRGSCRPLGCFMVTAAPHRTPSSARWIWKRGELQ